MNRKLWLIRLKEGDCVILYDGSESDVVKITTKDVLNNRIWFEDGRSVRCSTGECKNRRIVPML